MNQSILIDCYQKMTKIELNRLTLFIESPYYNKHDLTKKLHYYLFKQHPDFDERNCKKELVFKKIFGEVPFKNQMLKDVIFKLSSLLEQFLIAEKIKEDKMLSRQIGIEMLFEKSMSKLAKKSLTKARKEIKGEAKSVDYFQHLSQLNYWSYNYEEIYGDRLKSAAYLQQKSDNLDYYYFAEKLMLGSMMLNRNKVLQTQFSLHFYDELELHLSNDKSLLKKEPFIKLNLSLFQLLKEEEDSIYYAIKAQLLELSIEKVDLKVYYAFLRNYCIRKTNAGNLSFLEELFELNQSMIDNEIILENKVLSEWTYKNYISVGLRLKKFDWTENFIHDFSPYLDKKIHHNAFQYNIANLYYFQKKYDKALEVLLSVEYSDVFYMLSSKSILLKIYFEKNEFEAAENLLHSFRLLTIRQKKISTKQKNSYLNLISITDKILRLKMKKMTLKKEQINLALEKIKTKIETADSLANKTWVLEIWKELQDN